MVGLPLIERHLIAVLFCTSLLYCRVMLATVPRARIRRGEVPRSDGAEVLHIQRRYSWS